MKKNQNYEINFATKTITVTKKFLEAASQMGTDAFAEMLQLQALNMPIAVQEIHRKPKIAKWSYERMERYLNNVQDSEKWSADYKAMKESTSHAEVWSWFKDNFIQVDEKGKRIAPNLNENHKIIVMPKASVTPITKKSDASDTKTDSNAETPVKKRA